MGIGRGKLFLAKEAVHVYLWEGFLVKEVEEDARFFLEGFAALRHSFNLVAYFFFISFFCRTLLILESYTPSQQVGVQSPCTPLDLPLGRCSDNGMGKNMNMHNLIWMLSNTLPNRYIPYEYTLAFSFLPHWIVALICNGKHMRRKLANVLFSVHFHHWFVIQSFNNVIRIHCT